MNFIRRNYSTQGKDSKVTQLMEKLKQVFLRVHSGEKSQKCLNREEKFKTKVATINSQESRAHSF